MLTLIITSYLPYTDKGIGGTTERSLRTRGNIGDAVDPGRPAPFPLSAYDRLARVKGARPAKQGGSVL